MKIIRDILARSEVEIMAKNLFGELVKAVVDIERGIMAVDMELHADGEALLLQHGSRQTDLWGINLYPGKSGDDFVEFDSMINIRPHQNNRSRGVEDVALQGKIVQIVQKLIV